MSSESLKMALRKGFSERMQGHIERYSFQVGILEDGIHKDPKSHDHKGPTQPDDVTVYAGKPARKAGRSGTTTLEEVSAANRDRLGFNYLTKPFKVKTAEIVRFTQEFLKLVGGKSQQKRVENLLQAVVRNPILRGEYGKESKATIKSKTFSRPMIDTAQLFKAIKAIAKVKLK